MMILLCSSPIKCFAFSEVGSEEELEFVLRLENEPEMGFESGLEGSELEITLESGLECLPQAPSRASASSAWRWHRPWLSSLILQPWELLLPQGELCVEKKTNRPWSGPFGRGGVSSIICSQEIL